MEKVLSFFTTNWEWLSPVVYELFVRLFPTRKNWSLLDNILKVIGLLLPNRRKPLGNEDMVTPKKNRVIVDLFRHIITVLFLFVSPLLYGQLNQSVKGLASFNTDSATVKTWINSLQTTYSNVGGLYYNKQSSKWRVFYDSAWHDLVQGGGSGSGIQFANNGLTTAGDTVQQGGEFIKNTTIQGNGFSYDIAGLSLFGASAQSGLNSSILTIDPGNDVNSWISTQSLVFNAGTSMQVDAATNYTLTALEGISMSTADGQSISTNVGSAATETLSGNTYIVNIDNGSRRIAATDDSVYMYAGNMHLGVKNNAARLGINGTPFNIQLNPTSVDINGLPLELGLLDADPAGQNGYTYYNTVSNKFRCYENGSWGDCIRSGITNTALNNELGMSNGTNIVSSGIYQSGSGATLGQTLLIGSTGNTALTRNLLPQGTQSAIQLILGSKGGATTYVGNDTAPLAFQFAVNSATDVSFSSGLGGTGTFRVGSNTGGFASIYGAGNGSNAGGLPDGRSTTIKGGDADQVAGNGNGGYIIFNPGIRRAAGAGVDGAIRFDTFTSTGTIQINDGANEQMGVATLVAGTVTVNNVKVTATSRILLTHQNNAGTPGFVSVSARVAGTSFTITSASPTDTSDIMWLILEPAP